MKPLRPALQVTDRRDVLHRFAQQLAAVGQVKFLLDLLAMAFDGFHAQAESLGDLARSDANYLRIQLV